MEWMMPQELVNLCQGPVPWSHSDEKPRFEAEFPFIILTRFNFFRNLTGYPFLAGADPERCQAISLEAGRIATENGLSGHMDVAEGTEMELAALQERLILGKSTRNHSGSDGRAGLKTKSQAIAWETTGSCFARINRIEHFTVCHLRPGLISEAGLREILATDTWLEAGPRKWAYSSALGFLCSDPSRSGAGFDMALLVHLPGLCITRRLLYAYNALTAMGLEMTPRESLLGVAMGHVYWIRSKGGMGRNEIEIQRGFLQKTLAILNLERECQEELQRLQPQKLEDKVFKSFHLLAQSRILSRLEWHSLESFARLGAYLGILNPKILETLDILSVKAQTGHLHIGFPKDRPCEDEGISRANIVRLYLHGIINRV